MNLQWLLVRWTGTIDTWRITSAISGKSKIVRCITTIEIFDQRKLLIFIANTSNAWHKIDEMESVGSRARDEWCERTQGILCNGYTRPRSAAIQCHLGIWCKSTSHCTFIIIPANATHPITNVFPMSTDWTIKLQRTSRRYHIGNIPLGIHSDTIVRRIIGTNAKVGIHCTVCCIAACMEILELSNTQIICRILCALLFGFW